MRLLDAGEPATIQATIDEIVNPPTECQIPVVEQHLSRQDEDRHVAGVPFLYRQLRFGHADIRTLRQ